MGDKLVPKIVLIGKIKVEGSLCHAGLIDDVGDRSFVKTILMKSRMQHQKEESFSASCSDLLFS